MVNTYTINLIRFWVRLVTGLRKPNRYRRDINTNCNKLYYRVKTKLSFNFFHFLFDGYSLVLFLITSSNISTPLSLIAIRHAGRVQHIGTAFTYKGEMLRYGNLPVASL